MSFYQTVANIIRFRRGILFLFAIVTVLGLYQTASHLSVNNALSIWFRDDNPAYQEYLQFQEEQGSDQVMVVMIATDSTFPTKLLSRLQLLHELLDTLPFVNATLSVANVQYPIYSNRQLYYRTLYRPNRKQASMQQILDDLPTVKRQLISPQGDYLFFYAQLASGEIIEQDRRAYVQQLEAFIGRVLGNWEHHITGPPILNEAYSTTIYEESNLFAVMTILVIILLLFFLLPHWHYIPIAFASVAVTVSITLGIMTSMGHTLNLISMLLPTILMVYCISDSIHIINIFHQHRQLFPEKNRIQQIQEALFHSLRPCFYTTLTTVIGYLALALSPLPAFQVMGVFTFIGILLAFLITYLTTAIGFYYLGKKSEVGRLRKINIQGLIRQIQFLTSERKGLILIGGLVIFLLGLGSLFLLEINTNSLNFLRNGAVKEDLLLVEKVLGSSNRLQLNITRKDSTAITTKIELAKLKTFEDQLRQTPSIFHPVSFLEFKSFLEKNAPNLPRYRQLDYQALLEKADQKQAGLFTFFSNDYATVHININTKEMETTALENALRDIELAFTKVFPSGEYRLKMHGFPTVYAQLNQFILKTQFYSFGAAFVIAFALLFYFIGNIKTSLLALIPNLLPLALTLLVMTILGIDLEVGNAMLAPIMLGVAMDDTIHLMNKYKLKREEGMDVEASMNTALAYTGSALLSTTIALVAGFMIVGMSGVISVSTFGLLCALTILSALLADMLFLPALIKWGGR